MQCLRTQCMYYDRAPADVDFHFYFVAVIITQVLGTGSGLLEQNSLVFLGLCLAFFAGPNTWRTLGTRNQRFTSIRHDVGIIFMNFVSCTFF